ncbi:MAG: hypothetical protein DMD73_08605 [Gemmatimonadetes bacterium]|nr:MAG: hypothetical protein DMD73_08605 [Gemmatimonadota bacterium]
MRRVVGLCLACWMCGGVREDGGRGALVLSDRVDSGAGVAELQERLLTPYLARHPGLELVQRPIAGRDQYRRALLTALAGEDPPDVFLLDDEDVPRVVDRGVALDLVPYLPRIGVDPARYDQTLVAVFRRGAGLYGLPRGYTPVVVAYNKDLLDRAAIPYPTDDWTWDDFLRVAKQLTRDTDGDGSIDQWGSAFDGRLALWLPWIWAGGGDVLCADGRRASGCLDSRATIEAMRWYAGWMSAGIAPRIRDARDAPGAIARLFASGRLALMTTGHWVIPGLRATVAAGRLHVGATSPIPLPRWRAQRRGWSCRRWRRRRERWRRRTRSAGTRRFCARRRTAGRPGACASGRGATWRNDSAISWTASRAPASTRREPRVPQRASSTVSWEPRDDAARARPLGGRRRSRGGRPASGGRRKLGACSQ